MNTLGQQAQEQQETPAFDLQEIKKHFYRPAQIGDAEIAIGSIVEAAEEKEFPVIWNFDPQKDQIPEGYGILIQPINRRDEGETIVIGVGIGAVPEFETVQKEKTGSDWIKSTVEEKIQAKFANSIRPKDGELPNSVPFSVEDFITSQRAEGVLVAYRKLQKAFVDVLKKRGLKVMNEQLLRQVLQSSAFAEQHFPQVKQDVWNNILDKMIALAEKENMAPGMLVEWKDTRASAGLPDIQEIKMEDFDF